jgi:hypothetical protein
VSAPDWKAETACTPDFDEQPKAQGTTKVYAALQSPRDGSFVAYLVTYQSRRKGLCSYLVTNLDVDLVGPLDCTAAGKCRVDVDCVTLSTPDDERGDEIVSTVAPASARSIRLMFRSGRTAEYALDGPLYPGLPSRRIFMVDVGRERLRLQPGHAWLDLAY